MFSLFSPAGLWCQWRVGFAPVSPPMRLWRTAGLGIGFLRVVDWACCWHGSMRWWAAGGSGPCVKRPVVAC